jgi:hypothetical protein
MVGSAAARSRANGLTAKETPQMQQSHKLTRTALVTAIAMCFGAAPVYAQSSGSQGGSNSMQNPNNATSRDGTSGAVNAGTSGATRSNATGTAGSAAGTTPAASGGNGMTMETERGAKHMRAGSDGSPDPISPNAGTGASGKGRSGVGVPDTPGGNGLSAWAETQASSNNGRIARDAYMSEAGRRFDALDQTTHRGLTRQQYLDDLGRQWDAMDRDHQGLTPAQVSRLTGKVDVDASGPARTGSGAQAGNMGPGNSKAQ